MYGLNPWGGMDWLQGYQQQPQAPSQPAAPAYQQPYSNDQISQMIQGMIKERSNPQSQGLFGNNFLPKALLGGIAGYAGSLPGPGWGAIKGLSAAAYSGLKDKDPDENFNRRKQALEMMLTLNKMNTPQYDVTNGGVIETPPGGGMPKYHPGTEIGMPAAAPETKAYEPGKTMEWGPNGWQMVTPKGTESIPQASLEDTTKVINLYKSTPNVQKYDQTLTTYRTMLDAQGTNDPAADLNLVYGAAQIFDPGSIVRGQEGDQVVRTQGWPEWLKSQWSQVSGGGKLAPKARANLIRQARSRVLQLQKEAKRTYDQYSSLGKKYNIAPEDFGSDFSELPEVKEVPFGSDASVEIPIAPQGVDPNLWKHMTPEERALWQK